MYTRLLKKCIFTRFGFDGCSWGLVWWRRIFGGFAFLADMTIFGGYASGRFLFRADTWQRCIRVVADGGASGFHGQRR